MDTISVTFDETLWVWGDGGTFPTSQENCIQLNVESMQYVGPGGLGEARVKGMSIGEHCLLAGMDQQTKLEVE